MTKFVHAHKLIVGDIQPYEECYSISKNRLGAPKASLVNSDHLLVFETPLGHHLTPTLRFEGPDPLHSTLFLI